MVVLNADIARIFETMADLLEIGNANPFRIRAYRNAARVILENSRDIPAMARHDEDLTVLPGIGEDLSGKIKEIVRTGRLEDLETLEKTVPATLLEIRRITGLGPKHVGTLHRTLGVRTVEDLERAAKAGRLEGLEGFGEKTVKRVLESLTPRHLADRRFRLDIAAQYALPLVEVLKRVPGVGRCVLAGSFRRRKETVGDIDILVTAVPESSVMERFVGYESVREVVSKGTTRSTVILASGLQVDLRVVSEDEFGSAFVYFTGSKAHNIALRKSAQSRGLKINEYGVFRGKKRIAGATEESVYKILGLPFIPPELREDQGELEAAEKGRLPRLIERFDLKGDLHSHTSLTDGRNTLQEMADAARKRGLEYLAVTEHSHRLGMTHGLDAGALLKHVDRIGEMNGASRGFFLLSGIEVDILSDGSLDLPDSALSRLDVVIGAIHSHFGLSRAKQTERILKAMDQPFMTILAHPTGRLIDERPPMDLDWERIIRHAKERGTILEIDSQPARLDLSDVFARMARDAGVLLSIDSDAHSTDQLDLLDFGVGQARRGWVVKDDVVNTRSLSALRKILSSIRR
jgi:DNA polymerase (family 10)